VLVLCSDLVSNRFSEIRTQLERCVAASISITVGDLPDGVNHQHPGENDRECPESVHLKMITKSRPLILVISHDAWSQAPAQGSIQPRLAAPS
jgi:hypothetical protein